MLIKRRNSKAEPTPFTRERAAELLNEISGFMDVADDSSLTAGEDNYIHEVWKKLPRDRSWMDALRALC